MGIIWQMFYPVLIYDVVSSAVFLLIGGDPLLCQGIAAAAVIPVLLPLYMRNWKLAETRVPALRFLIIGAASSIFLNNLVILTGLNRLLTGYEEAAAVYASPFWVQLCMSGILIPAAEELIFRGFCFSALRTRYAAAVSAVVSAFLFGVFHGNPLQFFYAFSIGLILAWCREKSRGLPAPVLAHMAANLASVLLQNMMRSAGAEGPGSGPLSLTVTALAGVCLWIAARGYKKKERNAA